MVPRTIHFVCAFAFSIIFLNALASAHNITEETHTVRFVMSLTLQNPGRQDIHNGIVAVMSADNGPGQDPRLIGSFATIKSLPHLQQTTVKQAFSVSAAEFARWQSGHEPVMEFLVPAKDDAGEDTAIAEGIQVHRTFTSSEKP